MHLGKLAKKISYEDVLDSPKMNCAIYVILLNINVQGPLWRGGQGGHGPPTFLRVGKIKTHNKLSVECSPFKTKKKYSKLSRKTYLSSIINKEVA